ncbi:DUF4136 domain-containing protein [Candidatus Litorirhabdus singularis]|uniref:DUF4136 domain-containing protein n=1 Tax=Candidatus Litorirhabdus singularis TaxID=2518993 RepID=UPI00242C06E8|nr:DUF4136 domain-containing protein [Candidatus Litorirhabdus singularis]
MNSKKSGIVAFFLLTITALLAGCSSTPNTYSNTAPGTDFSTIKTYGFLEELATDTAKYQSLETNFLKVAVAQQLDLRGLTYDPVNPDVLMNFYIHSQEKIRSRQTPTMSGGYYGYRGGYYDSFGYGGMDYETRIEQYTEGTLSIDMIETSKRKLLWEGTVSGRITQKDVKNLEGLVDQSVGDIFEQFPIQ